MNDGGGGESLVQVPCQFYIATYHFLSMEIRLIVHLW